MTEIVNGPISIGEHDSLWRYVSLPALLLYLDGSLRLPSVQELRRMDPQEGVPAWDHITQMDAFSGQEYPELAKYVESRLSAPEREMLKLNAAHTGANQQVVCRHWLQLIVETRYALCFFFCQHESIAMWRLFAPKGFAIRTSFASLEKALQATNRKWRISRMKYWDKSREIMPDDTHYDPVLKQTLRCPYLIKSREYQYENEVRLCTVDGRRSPNLVVDGVRPDDWIQEIRISPEIWSEDANILCNLISERCPALKNRFISSPLGNAPSASETCWSGIEADVYQEDAYKNWPAFLHEP